MLKLVHDIRPSVYPFVFSTYSKTSFLIYGDAIISSEEGTQRGDPDAPAVFAETIRFFVIEMQSKFNEWYLDDKNLGVDYKTVLKYLKPDMSCE